MLKTNKIKPPCLNSCRVLRGRAYLLDCPGTASLINDQVIIQYRNGNLRSPVQSQCAIQIKTFGQCMNVKSPLY